MKNKKGFTLVELIAVIAILAIIALIVVPVINTMLKEARMNAFEDTAYGLIKTGQQYYAQKDLLQNKVTEVRFEFPDKVEGLELAGELPESGYMEIDKNGNISLAISNGRYCATKGYNDTKVTVTEDLENCGVSNSEDGSNSTPKTLSEIATTSTQLGVTSVDACATSGTCEPGTAFAIKVNNTTTYKFYVTSDDGNTVTLMLNKNLGNPVAWISDEDVKNEVVGTGLDALNNKSFGPITALRELKEQTSNWTNIPSYSYELNYGWFDMGGLEQIQGIYSGEYVQNVRARLPEESDLMGCQCWDTTCESWVYENLTDSGDNNTTSYWKTGIVTGIATSGLPSTDFSFDIQLVYSGAYYATNTPDPSYTIGVRPVIELSK